MAKTLIDGAVRGSHFKLDPNEVIVIGLDTEDGPEHDLYDKRVNDPFDEDMIASISLYGVIQPIRVVVDGDRVMVHVGRNRIRHAREAMKRTGQTILVSAIAEKIGDGDRLREIQVIENEHRRDDSPLAKAAKMSSALDRCQDVKRVAMLFRCSTAHVRSSIAMLALAAPVKKAIESGAISVTAAAKLADLPKAEQVTKLDELVSASPAKRVSVGAATRATNPDAPTRPSKKAVLAAIEAMKGTPWADGAMYVLGLTTDVPDAVAALSHIEEKEAAQ